jgi:hypothetical protein
VSVLTVKLKVGSEMLFALKMIQKERERVREREREKKFSMTVDWQ